LSQNKTEAEKALAESKDRLAAAEKEMHSAAMRVTFCLQLQVENDKLNGHEGPLPKALRERLGEYHAAWQRYSDNLMQQHLAFKAYMRAKVQEEQR
jgi:hypothetical protein